MNEKERIRNMVSAGTITDAEAERLLSVLDEIDRAEAELDASGEAMEAAARELAEPDAPVAPDAPPAPDAGAPDPGAAPDAAATPPTPGASDPVPGRAAPASPGAAAAPAGVASGVAAAAAGPAAAGPSEAAPEGTRWLHVKLLAGDVDVRADAESDEVTLSGDAEALRLEPAPDGYTLHHVREGQGESWVDRFLTRLRAGDVSIRVPKGYGVDLDVTAGDVDLIGVPYLRGRLTSGDLTARGLKGIDLVSSAGDIDLDLTLTEGRHRLRATAADVDIRLGKDSSVAVTGSVSIGSASVRAPGFEVDRRGIGQRFEGRIGEGAASLEVHVTTGDVDVEARE